MVLNEQGIAEHERQIDVINTIPSNKIDADPLKNISDEAMHLYDQKHLRDLREQVMAYDEEELSVVAEAIIERGWTFVYNVLGDYIQRLYNKQEATKVINNA